MPGCVMSIFDVVPKRIGGIETFARELSSQLASAGWRSVLCFRREPAESVRRFLEVPGIAIEAAPEIHDLNWAAYRRVAQLLRRYRPDVLHLSFVGLVSLYPWLARCCSVRRVFLTDQASRPEGYASARSVWWKRAIGRGLTWPVSRVIAVSDCVARFDQALGLVRSGNVARIYNAVDLTRPLGDGRMFRGKYSIPENRAVVLGVSWMIPEKGILDLLDAAKLVLSSNPGVHFVMVGEGACHPQCMEYAAQTGIADHVTWTGLVEDPVAEGVYGAADVVCQLSRWQEAFGFVIAEAMACRKPVIGTSVGGIPEVVGDGTAGFLVPPRQPAAAAQRILQLLGDASLRRRMGDAGRARVEELFDLRRTVAELIALYGISNHPARAGRGGTEPVSPKPQ
jgi:glycosyltransferase involved in cell wall biosynthesis